jgi:hypothetical protein
MFNLLPKDEKFYDELERLSEGVVSTAGQFEAVVASFPNFDGQLRNIEQDRLIARKVYGESLLRLDQAFQYRRTGGRALRSAPSSARLKL